MTRYVGNTTSCHTQAVFTAFPAVVSGIAQWLFEVLTSVPFGVKSDPTDPNRLLDTYVDPDKGLDIAFTAAGIGCETWSLDSHGDSANAWSELQAWVVTGPVVLGPVDMGLLPYLFRPEMLAGLDHYIVVESANEQTALVRDPERVPLAEIHRDDLVHAWRGLAVPEGRGSFVMRRVWAGKCDVHERKVLERSLVNAAANLAGAQRDNEGSVCIAALGRDGPSLLSDSRMRRGLAYQLSNRAQRCELATSLLAAVEESWNGRARPLALSECLAIFDRQTRLYGDAAGRTFERKATALNSLVEIAELENQLVPKFASLVEGCL